jgi:hypothetical protein
MRNGTFLSSLFTKLSLRAQYFSQRLSCAKWSKLKRLQNAILAARLSIKTFLIYQKFHATLFPSSWSNCAAVFTLDIFIIWAARIFSKLSLYTNFFSVEFVRHDCRPAPRFLLAVLESDLLKALFSTQVFGPSLYAR